jgi:hypothetical protein
VTHICPDCASDDVHHSRPRTFGEKLRFNFTGKVPFRCYACGWRDWLTETPKAEPPPLPEVHKLPPTDDELSRLEPVARTGTDDTDVIRR